MKLEYCSICAETKLSRNLQRIRSKTVVSKMEKNFYKKLVCYSRKQLAGEL